MSESFAAGLVGVVLDERYRLDALLGEGGMGAVYRAHHLAMDRKVAVKLLKPHLTTDETALVRFAREARATMKVESDHAVKVLDFGITPHKDYYMVLEYLDGRTVQQELEVDGPFSPLRTIHIARQSLRALGAAHAKGLVHRDVKPDNILLMRVGEDPDYAKVLDFGVAKLLEGENANQPAITQAGMVFGTPEFMSPEQATGQPLDGRSDLYALAATMFSMLTGCGMFKANAPIEWLTHHVRTPAPHLVDGLAALAPFTELDEFLQRCLSKSRDLRPRDAVDMIRLLDEVEAKLRRSSAPKIDASATLDPASSPARLPRQTDAVSAFTSSIRSELLDAVPSVTTGVTPVPSRRGLWLVLGAVAVLAMVIAVIVAARKKERPTHSEVSSMKRPVNGEDAAPIDSPPLVPQAVADASVPDAVPVDAGPRVIPDRKNPPPGNPTVAAHIAAAEEAKRAGNRLRQLAEADAALQADPRNVRARLLVADALIAAGDLDRGCEHLRMLGKNPTAVARARQAGCPAN